MNGLTRQEKRARDDTIHSKQHAPCFGGQGAYNL